MRFPIRLSPFLNDSFLEYHTECTLVGCLSTQPLIPSCVLRSHSEMGEIGHRTKKLLIVFKLTQLITKGISNGFKRGKNTSIKGFFPYFLPNMLNGIQFRTIGRLWDQPNILWNNKIFGIMHSSLIDLYNKKIFGKGSTNMF